MKQTLPIHYKLYLIIAYLLFSFSALAQEIEVTGKVTDETGPLPGVNISIKGMNSGTATDIDGNFSLKTNIGAILVISATGYKTQEIKVEQASLDIKLKEDVIICYGAIPLGCFMTIEPQVISAFSDLAIEDFNLGNIYHPYQLIRGKVPGLTISKPGGDPLHIFDVYQRGQHSLSNTDPLIVVDGLPGASLQTVDVQDIESVTVLRDAALASLYGTRGANGVIVIESKKVPWERKFKISYNAYASLENAIKTPNVLNANQFRSIVNDPNSRFYNPNLDFDASTDWAKAITRTGVSQAHNLALQGGLKNTRYRLSLNYRDVNGVAKVSGFNQSNALLNISQDLFKNRVQLSANAGITQRNFTEIDKDIFYYAAIFNPTAPIRTDTGYFQQPLFDYQNPVALLEQIDNQGKQTIYSTNLSAKWEILDYLQAEVKYGIQQQDYSRQYNVDRNIFPQYFNYNTKLDLKNQSLYTALSYNKYFDEHNFNLSGGYQYQEWTNELYNADDYDLAVNGLYITNVNLNAQPDSLATAYKTNTKLAAFFARLQYDFDNWLFFNAYWRHEGANRFGRNNKWGNFYGFGASVNFAELLDLSFVDYLKARVSYGAAGNLPIDGVYSKRTYQQGGRVFFNGKFIDVYSPATNDNPNLKWEERREWNLGMDAAFFNYRLSASIDVYHGQSKDMISAYSVSVPPNLAPITYANFVEFENNGVEIILNARLLSQQNFSWDFGLNYAANRSKFVSAITPEGKESTRITAPAYAGVPGTCCFQPIQLQAGKPLGRFVGYEFERFENGQTIFKDQNGDKIINEADVIELNNALPNFTFGILNEWRWKQLEFSFFLRGVMGHHVVNTHAMAFGFAGNFPRYNVLQTAMESPQNQVLYSGGFSDYFIQKASFATLENLALSYHFQTRKPYLSNLKIYLAAQNLFTLSNYSGGDPEVRLKNRGGNYYSANTLVPGLDVRIGYYSTRTFTLGVQAEF